MTTATATLVHSSSRAQDTRDALARVAAAGRIEADRKAREARDAAGLAHNRVLAAAWVDGVVAAGATYLGTKVCLVDGGKWRTGLHVEGAVEAIARWVHEGHEVEAWGLDADGGYVGEVLSVW